MKPLRLTTIVEREDDGYVSHCLELDIASQGYSVEAAAANLKEAIELFLECASREEVERRCHSRTNPRFLI